MAWICSPLQGFKLKTTDKHLKGRKLLKAAFFSLYEEGILILFSFAEVYGKIYHIKKGINVCIMYHSTAMIVHRTEMKREDNAWNILYFRIEQFYISLRTTLILSKL